MLEGRQKLIGYLADAHSKETAQISTLNAHISITKPGDYRRALEAHLRETQNHAERVQRRLRELGFRRNPVQIGYGLAQTVIGQGLVLAKAPIDMVRGMSVEEKMLKNARDELTSEALEIGAYEAIERMAGKLGDEKTQELAAGIRTEEERMFEVLRSEIPRLTDDVLATQTRIDDEELTIVLSDDELPIDGYRSLRVDEITPKLANLTQADLRKVEAYERANEGRKTFLDRISQLKGSEPWPGYDDQTVDEITSVLSDASRDVVESVREYERGHKDRRSVIDATERQLADA